MKNVRVWFEKKDTARYISHLDLNRCMSRAFHKTKLPVWYTQGFNPHAFLSFGLPLSLGMSGEHESMDIRLTEDISEKEIIDKLNSALPLDIHVYAVTEPVMKPSEIEYASYVIRYDASPICAQEAEAKLREMFSQPFLIISKHTKRGERDFNLSPYLKDWEMNVKGEEIILTITLPAGNNGSVNPALIKEAAKRYLEMNLYDNTVRTNLYNAQKKIFS